MILATRHGNREVRGAFDQNANPPSYTQWLGGTSPAGVPVTLSSAVGLPTVGAAVRLISETIASLPLQVFSGYGADKALRRESPAWRFLHDSPNDEHTAFDFISDVAACVETWGNAYIRKLKGAVGRRARAELLGLYVVDPSIVQVKRDERGRKVYEVDNGRRREELYDTDIIHVRGFTPAGGDVGLSPIAQHRIALGNALAAERFQGRFYGNDATPSVYISVPDRLDQDEADRLRRTWDQRHGGLENAGKVAVLGNGATLSALTVPMRDAQFIESQEHSSELSARIYLGPAASLLGADANVKTEEDSLRFVNFALLPRLRRIELAFWRDLDLFPQPTSEYTEFYLDEFLRADAATRAEVQHKQIQSGVLLVDEARADMGRSPLPDGMGLIPQITPVGGAPNAVATPEPTPAAA